MVRNSSSDSVSPPQSSPGKLQPLLSVGFGSSSVLSFGRAPDNDVQLEGPEIANHHARIAVREGECLIEDLRSAGGVFVNGERISGRRIVSDRDLVQIGRFAVHVDSQRGVLIFDPFLKAQIDCIGISIDIKNRSDRGSTRLLDDIGVTIRPSEFVGVLGPSGASNSALVRSMAGLRLSSGQVLLNNLDLYRHLASLDPLIGCVPSDALPHRKLTVHRALFYEARLRLSRDFSEREIDQAIIDVMAMTSLWQLRNSQVRALSAAQCCQVRLAIELLTRPSVILLDEVTFGLDLDDEEKTMQVLRSIAKRGHTVVFASRVTENAQLFHKVILLMHGKLVFHGTPGEALAHFSADGFADLSAKLEEGSEANAEEWRAKFQRSDQYRRNVVEPLSGLRGDGRSSEPVRTRRLGIGSMRQFGILARRYLENLKSKKPEPDTATMQEPGKVASLSHAEAQSIVSETPSARPHHPRSDTPGRDVVDCTVFAPPKVNVQDDGFLVQVFAHLFEQAEEAKNLAKEFDDAAERRGYKSLETEIERGSKLTLHLSMRGLEIVESVQTLVWRGRPESVQFLVSPRGASGKKSGTVTISQDGVPIGQISFNVLLLSSNESAKPEAIGAAVPFRQAFISYASQDRNEVLKRVQMLSRLGINFFQDVLNLEPGARWEQSLYRHIDESDMFLLFWSSAAKESKWVLEEIRYALKRKAGSDANPPAIIPVIIEGPPPVDPPEELAHLHFDDYTMYFQIR